MASKSNLPQKTLLGIKRKIAFPSFILKFCVLGVLSSFFFFDFGIPKHYLLIVVCLLNFLLLRKHSLKIVPFLLLSSFVISLIWWIVRTPITTLPMHESLKMLLCVKEYHNAMYTLWGCFLTGQIFLGITSQYEINVDLERLHTNKYVRLFVIILFNSVAYFIETYKNIKRGLSFRLKKNKKLSSVFYVFYTLMFDAIEIIIECKKAFWLNQERVFYSLSHNNSDDYYNGEPLEISELKIDISDIRYGVAQQNVIEKTEISLKQGVSLLVGANGSGKTTLFNGITGLIPETINGIASINFESEAQAFNKKNIGYVMQGIEAMFLYDTVEKALIHLPYDIALEGLRLFDMEYLLEGEKPISELSAGECKVVSLIGVLFDPKYSVILLDEPTMFLSETLKKALFKTLELVCSKKIVLANTHDQSMLKSFSTVFTLTHGKIVVNESIPLVSQINIDKRWLDAKVLWEEIVEIPQPICPDVYKLSQKNDVKKTELALCSNMNLGIVGANGAGKTSLGLLLCEQIKKSNALSIVMLLQDLNKQFFTPTVLDELLFGLPKNEDNIERANKYLEYMGLSHLATVPPQFISGGEKRLVLIGSLLMQNANIIILDEPFDSLDSRHIKQLIDLLCEHQKKTNCAYIFIDQSFELYKNLLDVTITIENFKIIR